MTDFHQPAVFRGCVGLAYPGFWAQGVDPDDQDVPVKAEGIPGDKASGTAHVHRHGLVHFDLDTQNAMIGPFDKNHPQTPVFKVRKRESCLHLLIRLTYLKIGDLGLAERFTDTQRANL